MEKKTTIQELRKAKGLTQNDVSKIIGITVTGYCKIERGISRLSESKYRTVKQLASILGDQIYEIADAELSQNKSK